jgi:sulfur-oxidizing protein SoxY
MDIERRRVLKGTGTAGMLAAALAAGILKPSGLLAAWNQRAFDATRLADALGASGLSGAAQSRDIVIDAPEFAENGAVVPVQITSNIAGTEAIAIFIDKNPYPYIARFDLSGGAQPFVALRVRGPCCACWPPAARTGATKDVKVTAGGCGGGGRGPQAVRPVPMKLRARVSRRRGRRPRDDDPPDGERAAEDASSQAIPEHPIQASHQLSRRIVVEADRPLRVHQPGVRRPGQGREGGRQVHAHLERQPGPRAHRRDPGRRRLTLAKRLAGVP